MPLRPVRQIPILSLQQLQNLLLYGVRFFTGSLRGDLFVLKRPICIAPLSTITLHLTTRYNPPLHVTTSASQNAQGRLTEIRCVPRKLTLHWLLLRGLSPSSEKVQLKVSRPVPIPGLFPSLAPDPSPGASPISGLDTSLSALPGRPPRGRADHNRAHGRLRHVRQNRPGKGHRNRQKLARVLHQRAELYYQGLRKGVQAMRAPPVHEGTRRPTPGSRSRGRQRHVWQLLYDCQRMERQLDAEEAAASTSQKGPRKRAKPELAPTVTWPCVYPTGCVLVGQPRGADTFLV
jgi:hypothetical protein